MKKKPTYEELEQKIAYLESGRAQFKESVSANIIRLADRSQDMIYHYDIPTRRYLYFNKMALDLFGIEEGDIKKLTPKTVILHIHPEDREKVRKAAIDSFAPGCKVGEVEYRFQHSDGSLRLMHDRWIVIRDLSGKPVALEGIVRDDTTRNQAEEALRNSEQLLNEMGSIAKIGGWEHDLVTGGAIWTQETYKIVEIESGPIPGPDEHLFYYPPGDREILKEAYRLSIETGEQFDLELKVVTAKGRSIWVRVVGRPEYKDGTCVKMKGIIQDITEQKTMERKLQQAQKMESIGNLAGGIAHDFNNILSSIIGFTELALDDVERETPLEDNLQEVYTAGKRARDLVKQILAFARQSDEEKKPIRVDAIAKEVLKLVRSTIPTTIEIKDNIESRSLIMGNSSQVHQLFMNLCTNAAQAMEDTGGVLGIGLADVVLNEQWALSLSKLEIGNYMKVTVSDTGTGISTDIIGSIFEPYFTTKGVGEGSGMGLALVHGIVESYGGGIAVDSELGKGTVFSIYLPIAKRSEDYRQYKEEKLPCGTERILFVDDELPIAKMGSRILEGLGYRVTVRTSSVEALELFRSKPGAFDLIITDMTMPNMTGDELAMELIASRYDIPVILCTGFSKKITDERAAGIGIKAFAYKPVVKSDLAKTVRKVLDAAKGSIQV